MMHRLEIREAINPGKNRRSLRSRHGSTNALHGNP